MNDRRLRQRTPVVSICVSYIFLMYAKHRLKKSKIRTQSVHCFQNHINSSMEQFYLHNLLPAQFCFIITKNYYLFIYNLLLIVYSGQANRLCIVNLLVFTSDCFECIFKFQLLSNSSYSHFIATCKYS